MITPVVVSLAWTLLIKAPMFLTRWRMAHALADYHRIYPTRSTWGDAQGFMARWGQWGNYEGSCTAVQCDYTIHVTDVFSSLVAKLSEQNRERVWELPVWRALEHVSYRPSALLVNFQVENGAITRTYSAFRIDVDDAGPPQHWSYSLGVSAQVNPRLNFFNVNAGHEPFYIMGDPGQLALHPDYIVGRPSGCEGCEFDEITYTPTLGHREAESLTSFNLSCLTRLHACKTIGDLLPYGKGWNLYEEDVQSSPYLTTNDARPLPCRTEARVLGRDATSVVEVDVLKALPNLTFSDPDSGARELVKARVLRTWKAPLRDKPGSTIRIAPFVGEAGAPPQRPAEAAEHLLPGHRELIFLREDAATSFDGNHGEVKVIAYPLDQCGFVEDNVTHLKAVQLGMSQDVQYRLPLRHIGWF